MRASSAAFTGPTTWFAISTSSMPSSSSALASHTFAVVMPIAPAAICRRARIGHLCTFACGRSAAGSPAIRRAISAMFRSTRGRSSSSAGVPVRRAARRPSAARHRAAVNQS